jgi:aminoglycoside phosphotransferase (APT) family kinase protein
MPLAVENAAQEMTPLELAEKALGVRPQRVVRQGLSDSGKAVFRVDLPSGESAVLRTSPRAKTFAFTNSNLRVLKALGLPMQSVLAAGATAEGGSYIVLNWLPGRDLIHELSEMSLEQMTTLAERVVECQLRVGSLPKAQRFGWAPIGRSGNLQKWTEVFGTAASAPVIDDGTVLGQMRSRLCGVRSRVEAYFETVVPTPFLDDLTTKNVLVENGALSGIIDVDFVCYGDPLLGVGATMASLAGDALTAAFYGDELIRCWQPNDQQRLAVWFYAALWGIGSFQLADSATNPARAQSLRRASEGWLSLAEAQ